MAYTLEITNGSTTYTFDVQPRWAPRLEYEYDTSKSPAVLASELETWELSGAVYRSATPANVTNDFGTLATLLSNRTTPVNSIKFKRDSTTVRELSTSTHTLVAVTSVRSAGGDGQWVNHWVGDLVCVGRRLRADADSIVRLETRITYSYDDAGLLTQTTEGKIETAPGTSAKAKAEAEAPTSLGAAFILVTGGDDGVEVVVENGETDTVASFRQVQREIGLALPSTATSWSLDVEIDDGPNGRETTYQASARGTTLANARTAVRTVRPNAGFARQKEVEDRDGLGVTASYSKREPRPAAVTRYGQARVTGMSRSFRFAGGGRNYRAYPVSGRKPFVIVGHFLPLTVRESVTVRAIGATSAAQIPLPAPLWPDNLQPNDSEDAAPQITDEGEQRSADILSRSAERTYLFWDVAPTFDAVEAAIFQAPKFAGEPDYIARMAGD